MLSVLKVFLQEKLLRNWSFSLTLKISVVGISRKYRIWVCASLRLNNKRFFKSSNHAKYRFALNRSDVV